jgi:hypothetical protein
MIRSAAQLRAVRHGLLRRMAPGHERSAASTFSARPSENCGRRQADEDREMSALPLVAMAIGLKLTTPDALAFPDAAFDLRKRLSEFPFEGWMSPPMEDDGR